jgi:hypothetical protein
MFVFAIGQARTILRLKDKIKHEPVSSERRLGVSETFE